ncbi:putative peptidase [Mycolicibacterium madagascariense]|uniref:Putative peptidase n=1 Tax=Mycolicibacterium madagascariense TaxID=212765 RepID=A0A7I7XBS1_9MYCO|nr:M24 family metallopeptidase [Mycolicibacterium madagascariense]MCV7014199.1 M24 family metallopeptidase [Mycolicibacterium madagascariense]BBZ25808.1 putative peptidase [Mycolicibacterium madagascariense]
MPHHTFGNADVPTFTWAERDRRWDLARAFMAQHGLTALLVYGEHEDAGASQFNVDTWFTNDRPGATVLMPRDGEPIAFLPMPLYVLDRLEATRRGGRCWVSAEGIRIGRTSDQLADALIALELTTSRIGVIGLDPYVPWHPHGVIPYQFWRDILTAFPGIDFRPVGDQFGRLIMALGGEELAVLRHAARLGEEIVDAMVVAARPGVPEALVYAAGTAAANMHGTVIPGMHLCSGAEFAASGPPHWGFRPGNPRSLREGDFLAAEVFSCFGQLQTQHQVAITLGEVHPDVEAAAAVARRCYEAGLATLTPTATFGEVAEAMLAPVELAGGWVRGPQIHSLNPFGAIARYGGGYPVDGMEQYPRVGSSPTACADLQLRPGMSFAFEPSCGFGRHVVTLGGTVIVGDAGSIELNPRTAHLLRARN